MSPSRWDIVNRLFFACLPLSPEERDAMLERECADDGEVRASVKSLLEGDDASRRDGFLKPGSSASLARLFDGDANNPNGPASGRQIGRFRLHGLLGTGGTSSVYRASVVDGENPSANGQLPAEFAFKLISNYTVTQDVLQRFRTEQKLLAAINHPGVARFVDGGLTDEGSPYLVMELVEGQRIDRFCDDNDLKITERVELVLQVCEAVDSVHRSGVLHRDLTPANILVTPQGVPKLVDFGIAKSTDAFLETLTASGQTATGAVMGTPAYLSPEQVGGTAQQRGRSNRRLCAGSPPLPCSDRPESVSGRNSCDASR